MEAFIGRALKQIRDKTSRSDKAIRAACDEVFAAFEKAGLHPGKAGHDPSDVGAADKYWLPFKLACQHRKQEVRQISLDCIEKLIAHGFLKGNTPIEGPNGERQTLIDEIVHTICECKEQANPAVEVQIIKSLLTAVSAPTCKVHGMSLVYAVRACYQIYLVTKDTMNNKVTAKGCLTQMLHVVFQSMEDYDLKRRADLERTGRRSWVDGHPDESVLRTLMTKKFAAPPNAVPSEYLSERELSWLASHRDSTHFKTMLSVVKPKKSRGTSVSEPTASAPGTPAPPNSKPKSTPAAPVVPETIYPSVAAVLGFQHVQGVASSAPGTPAAKVQQTPSKKRRSGGSAKHRSIRHQDAFLLFRVLCNLSVKSHTDNGTGLVNPYGLQSKILSLQLLQSVLRQFTLSFRINVTLINGMREHLCAALLENCLSSEGEVVELSLTLFMMLVDSFKDYLMVEIEAFICEIFLRVLESPTSPFVQKRLVLETFRKLCHDKNTLVEIFLNYDVTLDASGLPKLHGVYEQIVQALEKVVTTTGKTQKKKAFGRSSDPKHAQERRESKELAILGLQSLSAILDSLSKFLPSGNSGDVSPTRLTVAKDVSLPFGSEADAADKSAEAATEAAAVREAEQEQRASVGQRFDKQQQLKVHLKAAFKLFNKKPRSGVEFLQKKGIIETGDKAPQSIANWLATYPDDLDKTMIGDYLGDERYVDIMHAYVNLMDFTGLIVDDGIRLFLAGFRLPGEAQKIDRMMEAFAARYCGNNPKAFENCDACFVLSYSIIMLNTDLHNDNIADEKKITFKQFVNMTKGINNGKDFSEEFLQGIYTRIGSDAISLREDDEARAAAAVKKIEKHHHAGRAQEHALQQMAVGAKVKAAKATMLKNQRKYAGTLHYAKADDTAQEHVRPMFEVSCYPMLTVFCIMLDNFSSDKSAVEACVQGIRRAVHIAGLYVMEKPLQAFIESLCKYCNLGEAATFANKSPMSLECIRELLSIALEEGNFLHSSWEHVLAQVSQLARLQAFIEGEEDAEASLLDAPVKERHHNHGTRERAVTPAEREARLQGMMAVARSVTQALDASKKIDRIFLSSPHLNERAVKHFVTSLTKVSRDELARGEGAGSSTKPPRKFSLQKVVEVADYNMDCRGRFVWSQIWSVLSDHFTFCGCHQDSAVAMYAIDSLKQLSMKFLSKEEIRGFKFQKAFLKPFETIIKQSDDSTIRELILCVVQNMVLGRVDNIRSGWKNILVVLGTAAGDTNVSLVELGFVVAESLVKEHFSKIRGDFIDLLSCLLAFARGRSLKASLASLELLHRCAVHLALGHVPLTPEDRSAQLDRSLNMTGLTEDEFEKILDSAKSAHATPVKSHADSDPAKHAEPGNEDRGDSAGGSGEEVHDSEAKTVDEVLEAGGTVNGAQVMTYSADDETHVAVWWPLLMGLVDLVTDVRLEVRMQAVTSLLGSFFVAGAGFTPDMWELVFQAILFPLFDDPSHGGREPVQPSTREVEWLRTTGHEAFGALVGLFSNFFVTPSGKNEIRFLLPQFLALFERCAHHSRGHEFANLAISCEKTLLINCGHLFSIDEWSLVVESLRRSLSLSTPAALLRTKTWTWPPTASVGGAGGLASELSNVSAIESDNDSSHESGKDDVSTPSEVIAGTIHAEGKGADDGGDGDDDGEAEHLRRVNGHAPLVSAERTNLSSFYSDKELVEIPPPSVWTQCRIHHDLLDAIADIVAKNLLAGPDSDAIAAAADGIDSDVLRRHRLTSDQVDLICDAVESSYAMAVEFNADAAHRAALADAGFTGGRISSAPAAHSALTKTKPHHGSHNVKNLLAQETSAARKLLFILMPLLKDDRLNDSNDGFAKLAQERLPQFATNLIKRYVELDTFVLDHRCEDQPDRYEEGRMRNQLTPIVMSVVSELDSMEPELFSAQLPWCYDLLVDLTTCSNRDLRLVVAEVFRGAKISSLVVPDLRS